MQVLSRVPKTLSLLFEMYPLGTVAVLLRNVQLAGQQVSEAAKLNLAKGEAVHIASR